MSKANTWISGSLALIPLATQQKEIKMRKGETTGNQCFNFCCHQTLLHSKHIIIMQHKIFTKRNSKFHSSAKVFSDHAKFIVKWQSEDKPAPSSLFQQPIKNYDYEIHAVFKPENNSCLLCENTRQENYNKTCRLNGKSKYQCCAFFHEKCDYCTPHLCTTTLHSQAHRKP